MAILGAAMTGLGQEVKAGDGRKGGSWPLTLTIGLVIIGVSEGLLFLDLALRGGAVVPRHPLTEPSGALGWLARAAAVNITPLAWAGFLFLIDGLLERQGRSRGLRSPARLRPRRLLLCFLASVPIWLVFDLINFERLGAWSYHGLPDDPLHRALGYFVAFGAICPAMFLSAELFGRMGLMRLEGRTIRVSPAMETALMAAGLACLVFALVVGRPLGTLTLWLGFWMLLDPFNRRLGLPSLLGDWGEGRWGRTLSLGAGGLLCGLLWEFWNYWAAAKWVYHLPFLGRLEELRYFEMPLLGLAGFPTFALECWAMFQTIVWFVGRLGMRVEPLPRGAVM